MSAELLIANLLRIAVEDLATMLEATRVALEAAIRAYAVTVERVDSPAGTAGPIR